MKEYDVIIIVGGVFWEGLRGLWVVGGVKRIEEREREKEEGGFKIDIFIV